MCQPPWSLVRLAFLELHRLMPAGWPWQAGVGLLGLFVSTFFRPFLTPLRYTVLFFAKENPRDWSIYRVDRYFGQIDTMFALLNNASKEQL